MNQTTQIHRDEEENNENKKETCNIRGMTVDSTATGDTGMTGIMGEEGGVTSACRTMLRGQRLDKYKAMTNKMNGQEDGGSLVCLSVVILCV